MSDLLVLTQALVAGATRAEFLEMSLRVWEDEIPEGNPDAQPWDGLYNWGLEMGADPDSLKEVLSDLAWKTLEHARHTTPKDATSQQQVEAVNLSIQSALMSALMFGAMLMRRAITGEELDVELETEDEHVG